MFKFELNQLIYYMRNNKVCSAHVMSRKCVENFKSGYNHQQKELYERFGEAAVVYSTVHGEVKESEAFPSKETLLESL